MTSQQPALWRRAVAELLGTSLLVMIVVGSGIAAQRLFAELDARLRDAAMRHATGVVGLQRADNGSTGGAWER